MDVAEGPCNLKLLPYLGGGGAVNCIKMKIRISGTAQYCIALHDSKCGKVGVPFLLEYSRYIPARIHFLSLVS